MFSSLASRFSVLARPAAGAGTAAARVQSVARRSIAVATPASEDVGPFDELERTFLPPAAFYEQLVSRKVDFFTGVPDSLLKPFCAYVTDHAPEDKHVITPNEGSSIALAAGYHLATKKYPLVYYQNSGLGNTVNPLLSLAHKNVYSVPMLMLVGWRGEPGRKDEPQHAVQGPMTPGLLATLDVPFEILPDYEEGAEEAVEHAVDIMKTRHCPVALLVKKRTFNEYALKNKMTADFKLAREDAIRLVVEEAGPWDVMVGTTGFTSRELFELRAGSGAGHERDFLTVGSMGHASAIAAGVAIAKPSRNVVVLDGDGATLMHMGNVAMVGKLGLKNFKQVLVNNGAHDSVGAQPTQGFGMKFHEVAKACGYAFTEVAETEEEIRAGLRKLLATDGPGMLEVRVRPGARKNLGRPTTSTLENKAAFMEFLDN